MKIFNVVLMGFLIGCIQHSPVYVIDQEAVFFDFDQEVYVTKRMTNFSDIKAIAIESEKIFVAVFGKGVIKERPWHITEREDSYLVSGSLPECMLGGVAQLKVRKSDGFVWAYYHGK